MHKAIFGAGSHVSLDVDGTWDARLWEVLGHAHDHPWGVHVERRAKMLTDKRGSGGSRINEVRPNDGEFSQKS